MNWLETALAGCTLTDDVRGYLLGRAARPETISGLGLTTWSCPADPLPSDDFRSRYGAHGEDLAGHLITPLWSPRGVVLGFEARRIDKKVISRFLLPEAAWQPIFFGMKTAMPKLWAGGCVWLVEGQFDQYPLEWVVPTGDAVMGVCRAKLGDKQVEFLGRFRPPMTNMALDNDEAGRKGTFGWVDAEGKRHHGALDRLKRANLPGQDRPYSGGKDPGVLWDAGGVERLKQAFGL